MFGRRGMARQGQAGMGMVRQGRRGLAWPGKARSGEAQRGMAGAARRGRARLGVEWPGTAWQAGKARCGKVWFVAARPGQVRQGRQVGARSGWVW